MMFPTGCLPSASCAALVLLACRFLIRPAHPSRPSPRRACRASLLCSPAYLVLLPRPVMLTNRACPSRLIRSSATPVRLALLTLPASRVGGRGVIISFSSRHASRLPSLRFACPLLGVLTVILNAVAMGTVGCGAFVPRSRKLHLLSIGVVRISSLARRPFFLFSCLPVPRVDNR